MAHRTDSGEEGRRSILSVSGLRNMPVNNPAGEDLGKLEDVMLDERSGCVAYAVLSFGGFLGIGDKLFAIPWDELRLDRDAGCFVLNVSEDVLAKAPGFDKDRWPDFGDPEWTDKVHSHYGRTPYWRKSGRSGSDRPRA